MRDDDHLRLLCAFSLAPDSNCIDVGAHHGAILRHMVEFAPQGRHIAYEPLPELAQRLQRAFPQVDVRNRALSDGPGVETFCRVKLDPARSGLHPLDHAPNEIEELRVTVEALDSSLPADYVPALLKIDVEGAEQRVLEGAIRTIVTHKPLVVFEHQSSSRFYGARPDDIFGLLCDRAGLRIFDLDGVGPYSLAWFRNTVDSGRRLNFLARA